MVFPWFSHGFSHGFPMDFHGLSIVWRGTSSTKIVDFQGFPASHGWLLEGKIQNCCFLPWRMKVVNSIIKMRVTYFQPSNIYIYSYLYNFQEWGIEPPKNVTWLWGFISVHKRELIRHYFGEIDLLGVIISWKGMLLSRASVLIGQVFLHNKQPKVVGAWNGKILHVNNSKWWES